MVMPRVHGGPGADGPAAHDFSTNANAAGPCPVALDALRVADATRYPDPAYTALCESLARLHDVDPARIVIAASGSEFIQRITTWAARVRFARVSVPLHAFGEYAHAARWWNLEVVHGAPADLGWFCEPSSPLGQEEPRQADITQVRVAVLDAAYAPLRLAGSARLAEAAWQLHSPNKALGLTGVRAAYAVAPAQAGSVVAELTMLAPSWPLGAHGVAMLQAWCDPAAHAWLQDSLHLLRAWKRAQVAMLDSLGWTCLPSDANFFVARPPRPLDAAVLRRHGVQLRDCASFGLPGHVRLSVQAPAAQEALRRALKEMT